MLVCKDVWTEVSVVCATVLDTSDVESAMVEANWVDITVDCAVVSDVGDKLDATPIEVLESVETVPNNEVVSIGKTVNMRHSKETPNNVRWQIVLLILRTL